MDLRSGDLMYHLSAGIASLSMARRQKKPSVLNRIQGKVLPWLDFLDLF
jgi:hypothetical protein